MRFEDPVVYQQGAEPRAHSRVGGDGLAKIRNDLGAEPGLKGRGFAGDLVGNSGSGEGAVQALH